MNQLTKMFDGQNLTIIDDQGNPKFLLKNVCDILGLGQVAGVKRRLEDDVISNHPIQDSLGRTQMATFVNEDGLYDVILDSRKPEAKRFRKWITSEVLPSIRKTGGFVANDDLFIQTYLPQADEQTKLLFKTTLETIKRQNEQIAEMKPKALFADSVRASESSILIRELATILKQNGVDIGEKRLFNWLRQNKFLMKQKGTSLNLPTQYAMDLGLFEIKKGTYTDSSGVVFVTRTPKVTSKGQIYFINKFLNQQEVI